MDEKKLSIIRDYIVNNVMREPSIMFDDHIRGMYSDIDLIDVIASLYEELHKEVTGEPYEYMFHWANKIGAWVHDDLFKEV